MHAEHGKNIEYLFLESHNLIAQWHTSQSAFVQMLSTPNTANLVPTRRT
jgi:hypothetical protein